MRWAFTVSVAVHMARRGGHEPGQRADADAASGGDNPIGPDGPRVDDGPSQERLARASQTEDSRPRPIDIDLSSVFDGKTNLALGALRRLFALVASSHWRFPRTASASLPPTFPTSFFYPASCRKEERRRSQVSGLLNPEYISAVAHRQHNPLYPLVLAVQVDLVNETRAWDHETRGSIGTGRPSMELSKVV